MKKLIFSLLATITLSAVSFSQDFDKIIKDIEFQNYIKEVRAEQKLPKDIKKIKGYISDKKISENEFKDLHLALGYKSQKDYLASMESQNKKLMNLEKKYQLSGLQNNQMTELIEGGFVYLNLPLDPVNETPVAFGDCERRLKNTLALNFGVAVAAHIACGTVDITVVLGALCHAAVLTTHIAADDNARLDYKECINK